MKLKVLFIGMLLCSGGSLFAQYGFGTNAPNENAAVEISSPDKGVLLPRIGLTSSTLFLPGATASTTHSSMLVYNTSTTTSTASGLRGAGFYYWTTTAPGIGFWTRISTGPSLTDSATLDDTLRWDGSNWISSSALQNDGTDVTATGSLTVSGNVYGDTFTTVWTTTPPSNYAVNDVVLHEGRFYRNLNAATATSTTPSGTTALNAATWEPISSAPQILSFTDIGAGTATSTTATLTISEGNSLTLQASNGLEFNTAGTTNTLTLIATNEFTGTVSTSDTGLLSETLNLTLANDTTGADVFDLSSFEEVKAGTGTPSTQTFTPSATLGDLYIDTNSSTIWTYKGPGVNDWVIAETAVENIYTDDGTLTATRTINMDGNWLQFSQTSSSVLHIDPVTQRIYIGNNITFSGSASYTASLNGSTSDLDLVVEGDIKAGRFILDENNEVGRNGEVLTKTATGIEWKPSGTVSIETITASAGVSTNTTLLLIQPAANLTLTMPSANTNTFPEGYTLKIRRNQEYTATSSFTITIDASGTDASIDGATTKFMNVGYQSMEVIATSSGWISID